MKKIILLNILLIMATPIVAAATEVESKAVNKRILPIAASELILNYEDFDGAFNFPCRATRASPDNPFDFTVNCFDGPKLVRTLNMHLVITRYEKPIKPRTQYEILYWVNHEGATSWLNFDDITHMAQYQSSQSLAGESHALRLKLNLTASR